MKYCPTARKEPVMTSSAMRGLTRISVAGIRAADLVLTDLILI